MKHYYPVSLMRIREDTPVGLTVPSNPEGSPLLGIVHPLLTARCDAERHSNLLRQDPWDSLKKITSLSASRTGKSLVRVLRDSVRREAWAPQACQKGEPQHISVLTPPSSSCPGDYVAQETRALWFMSGWEVKYGFATPKQDKVPFLPGSYLLLWSELCPLQIQRLDPQCAFGVRK